MIPGGLGHLAVRSWGIAPGGGFFGTRLPSPLPVAQPNRSAGKALKQGLPAPARQWRQDRVPGPQARAAACGQHRYTPTLSAVAESDSTGTPPGSPQESPREPHGSSITPEQTFWSAWSRGKHLDVAGWSYEDAWDRAERRSPDGWWLDYRGNIYF